MPLTIIQTLTAIFGLIAGAWAAIKAIHQFFRWFKNRRRKLFEKPLADKPSPEEVVPGP